MKYRVQFNKRYIKDLEKIPQTSRLLIKKSILNLSQNPRPAGCKKLKGGKASQYRIRCGKYRIVYTIKDEVLLVTIIEIGQRKDIYR